MLIPHHQIYVERNMVYIGPVMIKQRSQELGSLTQVSRQEKMDFVTHTIFCIQIFLSDLLMRIKLLRHNFKKY